MENYTIAESYTLPSKGLVYNKAITPNVKLRAMTTEEEMKRLGHSERPLKLLTEIIDDCLIEKPGISSYDLCISDYQFLLYKLRVVTYGPDYKVDTICPICGKRNKQTINIDNLDVIEYSDELKKYSEITLPKCNKKLKLRLQTPRVLDDIKLKVSEIQKKSSNSTSEPAILFTLISVIESVDGEILDQIKLEEFVRHLNMADTNYILQCLKKLDFGIDQNITTSCDNCKLEYSNILPITGEFFGPSID